MQTFIEFGGLVFWIIVAVLLFLCSLFIESEDEETRGVHVTCCVAAFCLVCWLCFKNAVFEPFYHIDRQFVLFIILYFAAGLVWSFIRWFIYAKRRIAYWRSNNSVVPNDVLLDKDELKVKENISKIGTWILYWPISLMRYVLGHLATDLVKWIATKFSFVYESMTRYALK